MTKNNASKIPRVSIVCISYNQEDYISEAIEGFLAQKTDFPIEIVIFDDASTDKTATIIREYAKKNPGIFQMNLRKKNVGVKINITDALKAAKGEFIALCEGDDFWTDPLKLQKQVDFLDIHKDYALVFHPVRVFFQNHEEEDTIFPEVKNAKDFTIRNLLKDNYIQTNSVMYRRIDYKNLSLDVMPFDWYLHLTHAKNGKIGIINEIMGAYRRHAGGIWWSQRSKPQLIWEKYGYSYLRLLHEIMLMYGDNVENRTIINNHIAGSYEAIAALPSKELANSIAEQSLQEMPKEAWEYIRRLIQQVEHYSKHDAYLQGIVDHELSRYKQEIEQLTGELNGIKSSRAWKTINIMRHGKDAIQHVLPKSKSEDEVK